MLPHTHVYGSLIVTRTKGRGMWRCVSTRMYTVTICSQMMEYYSALYGCQLVETLVGWIKLRVYLCLCSWLICISTVCTSAFVKVTTLVSSFIFLLHLCDSFVLSPHTRTHTRTHTRILTTHTHAHSHIHSHIHTRLTHAHTHSLTGKECGGGSLGAAGSGESVGGAQPGVHTGNSHPRHSQEE